MQDGRWMGCNAVHCNALGESVEGTGDGGGIELRCLRRWISTWASAEHSVGSDLVSSGLVWFGLLWSTLVWSDLVLFRHGLALALGYGYGFQHGSISNAMGERYCTAG